MRMTDAICAWVSAAEELELLQALDVGIRDIVACTLDGGGHLRLVVDLLPNAPTRLRVRLVERSGGVWLFDTHRRVAPPALDPHAAAAQT